MNSARWFVLLGALNLFLAVALGAFGAHGLKGVLSADLLAVYRTGVDYQAIHGLGLLAVGVLLALWGPSRTLQAAGAALLLGIVLFSGSLYALSLSGIRMLGIITPFGGIGFLLGWGLLAWAAWNRA